MSKEDKFDFAPDCAIDIYFKDLDNYSVMTKDREQELLEAYKPGASKEELADAKKELIEGNLTLVIKCAQNFRNKSPVPFETMIELGNEALVNAAEKYKFNNDRKACFSTYAYKCIERTMCDYYTEDTLIHVPRYFYAKRKEMDKLKKKLGKEATDEVLMKEMELSRLVFNRVKDSEKMTCPIHMDSLPPEIKNKFEAVDPTTINRHSKEDLKIFFLDLFRKYLSDLDRRTMELYFFHGMSHKEIGKVLGVTRTRAHQRYQDSIVKLKRVLRKEYEKV